MTGAILYATKHGSTRDYADWIAEATGLPTYDIQQDDVPLTEYDFIILGCPIYYYKPLAADWMRNHTAALCAKPLILFTVSGAPAGEKLDGWLAASLPPILMDHADHFALQGRQVPKTLHWYDRVMLVVAGLANRDRKAGREEIAGFDYMDKQSIQPIVERINLLTARNPSRDTQPARVAPLRVTGKEKTGCASPPKTIKRGQGRTRCLRPSHDVLHAWRRCCSYWPLRQRWRVK